ncbi:hypothetical protein B0H15DRAFT_829228 [Mycena belliarum]|uniref:Acetyl-CoA synthetase-like protein n=1 Tax=Mycena belliarum TaxID=1033014 RepID=A0AAD6UEC2_9AGAR|nr:hypothetical protein B0H15DRAFT_829228 [Mycena belliae]
MSDSWRPQRTLAECHAILCAPGTPHELETCLIDGRIQRVYKNLWPSIRSFWLWVFDLYPDREYLVYEKQRYTYRQVFSRSLKAAAIFNDKYDVKKGDRVGICSRNYPEYLVAFWACHLIGAVPVLTNAWLPTAPLLHCLINTQCKLIMLDSERADRLEPVIGKLTTEAGAAGVVVWASSEGKGTWEGMQPWETVFDNYKGSSEKVLQQDPQLLPEDNALIIFTSGTTGLPKGVLSSQRQFLTNTLNALVARRRAILRRGESIPEPSPEDPPQGLLLSVPFFHVTMSASMGGAKIVLLRKWNPKEAARLIRKEKLNSAGGVPSMSSDLIESDLAGYALDGLSFGGAPAADILTTRALAAFPNVTLTQGYGQTENNSIAVSFAGEDYNARPSSCGLPSPVNDILIVKDGKVVSRGQLGEIWIRGPNVMKGYWRDAAATEKTVTKDGWLMSGDIGLQDEEGFDSTSVENALFTEGVKEVAAVPVPDERLGELVAAVVTVKPEFEEKVTEASLMTLARTRLPGFAVPVMIIFRAELPHNPSGKILKRELRVLAQREWEKRGRRAVAKL